MKSMTDPSTRETHRSERPVRRRGAILVLSAFLMVFMIGMIAMAIDIGYIADLEGEVQRTADAAAMAGAGMIGEGPVVARQVAQIYIDKNPVGRDLIAPGNALIEVGRWDATSRSFVVDPEKPSAVRVFARQVNQPLFFAKIFGRNSFDVDAEAIATYRPRDIVVVLDYSASMNDDSELQQIGRLGRAAVEQNLRQIYTELGSPQFGQMQWSPVYISSTSNNTIKQTLGLSRVAYPFPGGSWDDYIDYVKSSGTIQSAGYRRRYGYLTLVNYWLEVQPTFNETPVLWKTSEQPITAVKDAVKVFLAYLQEVETNDRVGLAVYTSADGTGKLESPLTNNYQQIEDLSRQRQAGHYDHYTNIGAGMEKARKELEANGRPGALKMMVLMTDGIANRPTSSSVAKQYVIREADRAASQGFPIVTVSLGAGADKSLMQQVADISGGVHFNVPGGQSVAQYEEDLKEVFREIADDRPLKLVK